MKKTFMYTLPKIILLTVCMGSLVAHAQKDSVYRKNAADTGKYKLNMDAVYNRPFLSAGKMPVALGGYLEANTQYSGTDGISDGFSFQMRRLTLFVSSTIAKKIKFLSEIEFEDGTREINLEFCALDLELHPLLNLRGGIVMNPIGGFNQNHDGPRWDFIDRPFSATGIIPTTLSNVGMGIYGKHFRHNWVLGYELYLTNGFDDQIIDNETGRTSLKAGTDNRNRFESNPSGVPLYTGKLAVRNRQIGELGISYMNGIYNSWRADGIVLDQKRGVSVVALDFNTALLKSKLNITGEWAQVLVDIPENYAPQYGSKQSGAYADVVYTLVQRKILDWKQAKINVGIRGEFADYNIGSFKETQTRIGDEIRALVPSLAFRPTGTTVIRFNFRFEKSRDFLYNPPVRTHTAQFGFSSYF